MEIGKRFKIIRKSMGLNQTDFGKIFGLKYQTISDIERGIKEPSKTSVEYAKFRFGENFGLHQSGIPPGSSSAPPGSTFGDKGIVICGHEFRNKKIVLECVYLLWNLEQLSNELFNHGQMCLQMLLDGANIMVKKIKNQS